MFWFVRPVNTIFSLTQRSRLDWFFRHLEHVRQAHRNFSRSLQFKKTLLKTWGFVRIFQPDFEFHFSKYQLFSLLLRYNLIAEPCGHDFVTEGKIYFEKAYTYLENVRKGHRKSFGSLWKKFQLKTWVLSEYSNLIFAKSQLFSFFLTYNLIGALCGHDFLLTQN